MGHDPGAVAKLIGVAPPHGEALGTTGALGPGRRCYANPPHYCKAFCPPLGRDTHGKKTSKEGDHARRKAPA
jgi:hypothetical protein